MATEGQLLRRTKNIRMETVIIPKLVMEETTIATRRKNLRTERTTRMLGKPDLLPKRSLTDAQVQSQSTAKK